MANEELKEWKVESGAIIKIASALILDGTAFSYDGEDGIVFTAPSWYVDKLGYRMVTSFGCRKRPVITEIK